MILHIQYKDNKYDYIDSRIIDGLIDSKLIKQIYRPSEKRWVETSMGPLRGQGGSPYLGPDRRQSEPLEAA